MTGVAKAFEELVPRYVKVEADGVEYEGEFLLGGVFNSRSVAGLIKLDKSDIVLDDGFFELILIRKPKNTEALHKTLNQLSQQKFTDEHVIFRRVKNAKFTFEEPTPWSLDGEFGGAVNEIEIKNLPRAVSIFGKRNKES